MLDEVELAVCCSPSQPWFALLTSPQEAMLCARPPAAAARFPPCGKEGCILGPGEFLDHLQELDWYQGQVGVGLGCVGGRPYDRGRQGLARERGMRVARSLHAARRPVVVGPACRLPDHKPTGRAPCTLACAILRKLCVMPAHDHTTMLTSQIEHIESTPAKVAVQSALRAPLSEPTQRALAATGVRQLFRHQADAIDALLSGENVVVATSTASGKSLCYTGKCHGRLRMSGGGRSTRGRPPPLQWRRCCCVCISSPPPA